MDDKIVYVCFDALIIVKKVKVYTSRTIVTGVYNL